MNTLLKTLMVALIPAIGTAACDLIRTPQECEEDLASMQAAVSVSISSGQSCQFDSECTLYDPSNGCFGSCSVSINAGELPRIDQEIAAADAQYCLGYKEQCGYDSPSCPELSPACIEGTCILVDLVGGP